MLFLLVGLVDPVLGFDPSRMPSGIPDNISGADTPMVGQDLRAQVVERGPTIDVSIWRNGLRAKVQIACLFNLRKARRLTWGSGPRLARWWAG